MSLKSTGISSVNKKSSLAATAEELMHFRWTYYKNHILTKILEIRMVPCLSLTLTLSGLDIVNSVKMTVVRQTLFSLKNKKTVARKDRTNANSEQTSHLTIRPTLLITKVIFYTCIVLWKSAFDNKFCLDFFHEFWFKNECENEFKYNIEK